MHHVVAECFVASRFAEHVHRNSDLFISTPSILGEAFLEVGAPHDQALPGPAIVEGERVRGADPPDIDRLLAKLYSSATEGMLLLREQKPDFDALLGAGDALLADLAGIPIERGQLGRIRDRVVSMIDDVTQLASAIERGKLVPRTRALATELSSTIDAVRPDLSDVADKAERAADRIAALPDYLTPADREKAERGLRALSRAAKSIDHVAADAQAIAKYIDSGAGSAGGFLADKELWDDLHETHRILKWMSYRFILKTPLDRPTAPQ
jgi:ABC-type transporter Mla subunit MlaD